MGEGNIKERKSCFPEIDHFWKKLILQTVYGFYQNKFGQWDMLLSKLKEISAGIDCKIPYGRTMLHVLVKTGLQYEKADNQKFIIKGPRLAAWRYQYLINVHKYHDNGCLMVYLDNTWFVSRDTVRMLWSDSTKSSSLSEPPLRGKWVVKSHAWQSKSFLEYSLFIFGQYFSM